MNRQRRFVYGLLLILFVISGTLFAKSEVEDIQQAIKSAGANWTAGENRITRMPVEERRALLGDAFEPYGDEAKKEIELPKVDLPEHFDWRDNNGNWVTGVRDQGACGSCWDFSAIAQVESWYKIHYNDIDTALDLSEQFIMSCEFTDGCNGGLFENALEYIRLYGVPLETDLPYQEIDSSSLCDEKADEWDQHLTFIPAWGYVTLEEPISNDNLKAAVLRHPVSARYVVYSDFYSYTGGVYQHVSGDAEGGHAVLIVGWDDAEECWIVKNSWGPDWGESGYFRIKWGDSNFGRFSAFIYEEYASNSELTINEETLNFELKVGESTSTTVTIKNTGSSTVEMSTVRSQIPTAWHVDTLRAYADTSIWCGDTEIGGYNDGWLQTLDAPMLDLSTTSAPALTFMVNWAMEGPAGAEEGYDGWDGCNVSISTDGGKTFSFIQPTTPAYTCSDLWSFGHPEQGWGMGLGVPGWAGKSGGWVAAEFDLSAYKEDSVIIRWSLASDQGQSTPDDASLYGLLIDDVLVADGATAIYANNGNSIKDMVRGGDGNDIAAWLELSNSGGVLEPGDSLVVNVDIATDYSMTIGEYIGKIYIISNDTTAVNPVTYCYLNLLAPDHDVAVTDIISPDYNLSLLSDVVFGAELYNWGANDESDVNVVCTFNTEEEEIYRDTAVVSFIGTSEYAEVEFAPVVFTEKADFNVSVSIVDLANDFNDLNNSAASTVSVNSFVSGFEGDSTVWELEGGWAPSSLLGAKSGFYNLHCNGGTNPYENDMDAYATFLPGFDISSVEYVAVEFYAIHQTEADVDYCYMEISSDSTNWVVMDSLSGLQGAWKKYTFDMTSLVDEGAERGWFRFHFVSDGQNTGIGVLLDDIMVTTDPPVAIEDNDTETGMPEVYKLSQNYPNPFNPTTTIDYQLPEAGLTTIRIYNCLGELVTTLVNENKAAGYHTVNWDATDFASGIYIFQIESGTFRQSKKCLFLK